MSASTETSAIAEFYKGKSVFITGATGFIGKQLVEKLVRSCPEIGHIYLLVRSKRGHNPNDRVKELLASPLYDTARSVNPNFEKKIIALHGDIVDPNFGLTSTDEDTLIENCQVVFHSAATVRFNEPLRLALQMNVASVKILLSLCHKMKRLESVLHVSTAYANCNRSDVAEIIYPSPIESSKLLDANECMDDHVSDALTDKIIGDRPNTYTFTKALAEYVISQESKGLPLAIIRPSVVGSSLHEPVPGWVDSYNGLTGVFVAVSRGILQGMPGRNAAIADVIPVDTCVNMMIAVAWHTAMKQPKNIPVFHCTSGHLGTLTWGKVVELMLHSLETVSMDNTIGYPHFYLTKNRFRYLYTRLIQEKLRAFIFDCYIRFIGGKTMYCKLSDKIHKTVLTLEYFTSHSWNFSNGNSVLLQNEMTDVDQKIFSIDLKDLNWTQYMLNFYLGIKQYLLHEDLGRMSQCRKRNLRIKRLQNILWFILVALILMFVSSVLLNFFG